MANAELEFEWDEAKARSNLEKHGVSFLTAAAIFSIKAFPSSLRCAHRPSFFDEHSRHATHP